MFQPCSNHVPEHGKSTVFPCSYPFRGNTVEHGFEGEEKNPYRVPKKGE